MVISSINWFEQSLTYHGFPVATPSGSSWSLDRTCWTTTRSGVLSITVSFPRYGNLTDADQSIFTFYVGILTCNIWYVSWDWTNAISVPPLPIGSNPIIPESHRSQTAHAQQAPSPILVASIQSWILTTITFGRKNKSIEKLQDVVRCGKMR